MQMKVGTTHLIPSKIAQQSSRNHLLSPLVLVEIRSPLLIHLPLFLKETHARSLLALELLNSFRDDLEIDIKIETHNHVGIVSHKLH